MLKHLKAAKRAACYVSTAFVDPTTREPLPAYTAIKGLMDDVREISAGATGDPEADLPSVTSYTGRYPLMTAPIVGRQAAPPR